MASHLLWFRLPKGRVWHVACSGALVALCGQSIPARGERQPKRPPFGARPCPDCHLVADEARQAIIAAVVSHKGPMVLVGEEGPELFEFKKPGEVMLTSRENPGVDLVAALRQSVEAIQARRASGFPACEDCGHTFGNHDSLGVCQDVDENGDACECSEYLALCSCGHPWALHDVDTGECCFQPDRRVDQADEPKSCRCEQFRPVAS